MLSKTFYLNLEHSLLLTIANRVIKSFLSYHIAQTLPVDEAHSPIASSRLTSLPDEENGLALAYIV